MHPYFGNEAVRAANTSYDVVTEAWSPIARGEVLDDPVIGEVARRLERSPAQVTLRWHVQRGDVVFPKSVNPDRMRENFALFDFGSPRATWPRSRRSTGAPTDGRAPTPTRWTGSQR